MSKGKEHKKDELGSNTSVVMTKTHGWIVGAVDQVNLLLAATAWHLKKWLRAAALFCLQRLHLISTPPTLTLSSLHP